MNRQIIIIYISQIQYKFPDAPDIKQTVRQTLWKVLDLKDDKYIFFILLQQRKEKGSQDLDFLERVDDELNRGLWIFGFRLLLLFNFAFQSEKRSPKGRWEGKERASFACLQFPRWEGEETSTRLSKALEIYEAFLRLHCVNWDMVYGA